MNNDLKDVAYKINENEHSRNILWLGTSIPEKCHYPQRVCENLGYNCYNMALGSSGIVLNSGILGNGRDCKDLSESTEEKQIRYGSYIGTSSYITETCIETSGYDYRIIPYIDGTIASCDTIVFDHGYNDREQIAREIDNFDNANKSLMQSYEDIDRTTYIGAFIYLVKKIWSVNPNIKIIICSYLENKTSITAGDYGQSGEVICRYLKMIADYFGFPYLNMCDYNGFTTHFASGTENYLSDNYGSSYKIQNYHGESNPDNCISLFQYYCPDGIHPHTDTFGRAETRITSSLTHLMRDL